MAKKPAEVLTFGWFYGIIGAVTSRSFDRQIMRGYVWFGGLSLGKKSHENPSQSVLASARHRPDQWPSRPQRPPPSRWRDQGRDGSHVRSGQQDHPSLAAHQRARHQSGPAHDGDQDAEGECSRDVLASTRGTLQFKFLLRLRFDAALLTRLKAVGMLPAIGHGSLMIRGLRIFIGL